LRHGLAAGPASFRFAAFLFGDLIRQVEGPVGLILLGASIGGIIAAAVIVRSYGHRIVEHAMDDVAKGRGKPLGAISNI
jgi:hypothetical protein